MLRVSGRRRGSSMAGGEDAELLESVSGAQAGGGREERCETSKSFVELEAQSVSGA